MDDIKDWREAARGIPLWEGARLLDGARVMFAGKEADPLHIPDVWAWGRGGMQRIRPDDVPDLSDPDTRAAYDRRLALALGAPEELVSEGAAFAFVQDHGFASGPAVTTGWYITAGVGESSWDDRNWLEPSWSKRLDVDVPGTPESRLLARALAWPASQRAA